MSLNYSALPTILDDAVRTIGVKFYGDQYVSGSVGGKMYTYMTKETFEVGDVAVVNVSGTFKCVEVVELDPPIDDSVKCYKWAVCRVNQEPWEMNVEMQRLLTGKIKNLEKKSQKKQILEALGLDVVNDEEIKKIEFQ
jgi:hypothetical protein